MEKKTGVGVVGVLVAVSCMFSLIPAAYGIDDVNLGGDDREEITMSPTTQKHEIEAGESYTGSFKVINSGKTDYTFLVYTKPFSVKGEEYSTDYSSSSERADADRWVQFDTTEAQLKPGDEKEISYTVQVPEDASIGGHYAVLFAETQPDDKEAQGSQIIRKKRVGMVLRVNVAGDIRESGTVLESSLPFLQFSSPLASSLRIENSGNVDFDAQSSIRISDAFGSLKYSADKPDTTVYPDTIRRIDYAWNDVSWFGIYKVVLSAKYLDKDYLVSRYVLVIPQWLIVLVIIGGAFGLYALYQRRR